MKRYHLEREGWNWFEQSSSKLVKELLIQVDLAGYRWTFFWANKLVIVTQVLFEVYTEYLLRFPFSSANTNRMCTVVDEYWITGNGRQGPPVYWRVAYVECPYVHWQDWPFLWCFMPFLATPCTPSMPFHAIWGLHLMHNLSDGNEGNTCSTWRMCEATATTGPLVHTCKVPWLTQVISTKTFFCSSSGMGWLVVGEVWGYLCCSSSTLSRLGPVWMPHGSTHLIGQH